MKYKIGLYLTILISAGVYCPLAFADSQILYTQPLHADQFSGVTLIPSTNGTEKTTYATTTNQGYLSSIQIVDNGVYNGVAPIVAKIKITDSASTTVYGTSDNFSFTRTGDNQGTTTANFTILPFLTTGTQYMIHFIKVSGTGEADAPCPPINTCTNGGLTNNYSMKWNSGDPNLGSIVFATPVNGVNYQRSPITFSGQYTNNGSFNFINLNLVNNGINNDGIGGYTISQTIPIGFGPGTLNFSQDINLNAGFWSFYGGFLKWNDATLYSTTTTNTFRVIQNVGASTATSTPYGLTITMATGSIQLPVLQGIATSTCTGDLITDFGCNFKNGLIIFTNTLIVPDTSSLGYISTAFSKFQSVFPFSVFFTFQTYSQANLSLPQQGQTLTIPQLGTFTPQINLLSSTTMSNFFGTSVVDDYFNFWQNVIWIATFIGMIYVII